MKPLELSEEQIALRDTVRKALEELFPHDYLQSRVKVPRLRDAQKWSALDQLGLRDYFPHGRTLQGSQVRDLSLIAAEVGRSLCPETIVESIFARAYVSEVKEDHLCMWGGFRTDLVIKIEKGNNVSVSGEIKAVLGGSAQSLLFVSGEGSARALYQCDVADPLTVTKKERSSLDIIRPLTDLTLKNAVAHPVGNSVVADAAMLSSALFSAAELSGIADRVVEMTTDYIKTRRQYGVPVGGFQAVQHQAADMYLRAEALRALVNFASWTFEASPDQREISVLAALRTARESVPWIVERSIQLHGGIGFTWEFDLHLFLRRARLVAILAPESKSEIRNLVAAAQ